MKWFERFETNNMKLSQEKCHLQVSGHKCENVWVKMRNEKTRKSAKQKLLGSEIGRNLNFDSHVVSLCKKAEIARLVNLQDYLN